MYIFYFIFLILPRSLSCFRIFLDTLPHMVTNGNVLVTSTATTNTLPSTTAITSRPTFSPPEPTKPPVPKYKRGKVKFISYELFPPSVNLTSFQMSNEQEKFMRYESSPQKNWSTGAHLHGIWLRENFYVRPKQHVYTTRR